MTSPDALPAAVAQVHPIDSYSNGYTGPRISYLANPTGAPGTEIVVPQVGYKRWDDQFFGYGQTLLEVDRYSGELRFQVPSNAQHGDYWDRFVVISDRYGGRSTQWLRFHAVVDGGTVVTPAPTPAVPDNQQHSLSYPAPDQGQPGQSVVVKQHNAAPAGTTYTISGPYTRIDASGTITFSVPGDAKDGDYWTRHITAKYPDGTTNSASVRFSASKPAPVVPDNERYEFSYPTPDKVEASATVKLAPEQEAPAGVRYSVSAPHTSVDPATGEITFKVPDNAKEGDYWTREVTATYADGTMDKALTRFYAVGAAPAPDLRPVEESAPAPAVRGRNARNIYQSSLIRTPTGTCTLTIVSQRTAFSATHCFDGKGDFIGDTVYDSAQRPIGTVVADANDPKHGDNRLDAVKIELDNEKVWPVNIAGWSSSRALPAGTPIRQMGAYTRTYGELTNKRFPIRYVQDQATFKYDIYSMVRETTAPSRVGNSGGPITTSDGKVIGVQSGGASYGGQTNTYYVEIDDIVEVLGPIY